MRSTEGKPLHESIEDAFTVADPGPWRENLKKGALICDLLGFGRLNIIMTDIFSIFPSAINEKKCG